MFKYGVIMFKKQEFMPIERAVQFFGSQVKSMKVSQLTLINGFFVQKIGDELYLIQRGI